jgi:hypothetical protein
MPERFVTVATYGLPLEAEMAKNLLEAEGIACFLQGDLAAGVFVGNSDLGGLIRLQVNDRDAPRAAGILAASAAEATLDEDWESEAEEGAGVWVCSLCGTPVSDQLTVCYACETPRTDICTGDPDADTRLRDAPPPAAPPPSEAVQRRDDVTSQIPPARRPPPAGPDV